MCILTTQNNYFIHAILSQRSGVFLFSSPSFRLYIHRKKLANGKGTPSEKTYLRPAYGTDGLLRRKKNGSKNGKRKIYYHRVDIAAPHH